MENLSIKPDLVVNVSLSVLFADYVLSLQHFIAVDAPVIMHQG